MSAPFTIAIEARANTSGINQTMAGLRDLRREATATGAAGDVLRAKWDAARGNFAAVRGELVNTWAAFGLLRGGINMATSALSPFLNEMDRIGRLNDLAAMTGESVANLMVLEQALQLAGRSGADIPNLFARIAMALSGVNDEGEPTSKVWSQLGLSMNAVRKASPLQQVEMLTAAIGRLRDPVAQADAAMKLFGRGGAEFLVLLKDPKMLGDARRMLGDLPKLLSENAERWDKLGDRLSVAKVKMEGVVLAVLERIGPILEDLADILEDVDPRTLADALMTAATAAGVFTGALATAKVVSWAREIAALVPLLARVAAQMKLTSAASATMAASMSFSQVADASAAWGLGGSALARRGAVKAYERAPLLQRMHLADGGPTGMLHAERAPLLRAAPSMAQQAAGQVGRAGVAQMAMSVLPTVIGAVASAAVVAAIAYQVGKALGSGVNAYLDSRAEAKNTRENTLNTDSTALVRQMQTVQDTDQLARLKQNMDVRLDYLRQLQQAGGDGMDQGVIAANIRLLQTARANLDIEGEKLVVQNAQAAAAEKAAAAAKKQREEWQAAMDTSAEAVDAMDAAAEDHALAQAQKPEARLKLIQQRQQALAREAGISGARDPMADLESKRRSLMEDLQRPDRATTAAHNLKLLQPIYEQALALQRDADAQRAAMRQAALQEAQAKASEEQEILDEKRADELVSDREYFAAKRKLVEEFYAAQARILGQPVDERGRQHDLRRVNMDELASAKKDRSPAARLEPMGDRLSRIGGTIGGTAASQLSYARRTAEGVQKTNQLLDKLIQSLSLRAAAGSSNYA